MKRKSKIQGGVILAGLLILLVSQATPIESGPLPTPHTSQQVEKPQPPRVKATMKEKRANERMARQYSKALGYSPKEVKCLIALWTRESRFDHLADNPRSTAYGIAQRLREKSRDPAIQILHGLRYLQHRYSSSACRALIFHRERGWY